MRASNKKGQRGADEIAEQLRIGESSLRKAVDGVKHALGALHAELADEGALDATPIEPRLDG